MQQESTGIAQTPSERPISVSAPVPAQSPIPERAPSEPIKDSQRERPMYTTEQQSHINDLVGFTKKSAYEKGKQDAQEQYHSSVVPAHNATPHVDEGKIKELVRGESQQVIQKAFEELQVRAQQEQQQRREEELKRSDEQLAQELLPKIDAAKQKYADFGEKVDLSAFENNREFFKALNSVDNTGEVMYELLNGPLGTFSSLRNAFADGSSPWMRNRGYQQLQTFSQSLKNNEASASKKIPSSPLGEIRPSHVKNSGEANVTKWAREHYKNRI